MGEAAMAFSQEQLSSIGEYVRIHLHEWIGDSRSEYSFSENRDMEFRERIIRVEESIKAQLVLMRQGFEQMEKRFEQVDKRFEQVDKRFEEVRNDMNQRFSRVDRQFGWVYAFLSATFVTILGGMVTLLLRTV